MLMLMLMFMLMLKPMLKANYIKVESVCCHTVLLPQNATDTEKTENIEHTAAVAVSPWPQGQPTTAN